ncbi:MAG: hypothetical protein K8S54_02990 [Spirochaetia bacterium]|nr:hypothetical protein [Spirochaetia bacterium]
MLRVILVSSEVTYVPDNYAAAFNTILRQCPGRVVALVALKVVNLALLATIAKLWFAGCHGVAGALANNIVSNPAKKRRLQFAEHGAAFIEATTMNDAGMIEWVRANRIDLIVNMRTRCIYREEILRTPRLGCVNIHHGLLPKYRGLLCDAYALFEGREAGFTVHSMNAKIDDGGILKQAVVEKIDPTVYTSHVQKSSEIEGGTIADLILQIEELGQLPPTIPNKSDGIIHTRTPSLETIRKMRKTGLKL